MNTSIKTTKLDTKVLLSTLWIVIMINMAYADILGLFIPGALEEVAKTSISTGMTIPQLMLFGAVMLEIPIAMILLSRVLKYQVNRWINMAASVITIVYVVGMGSLTPHYLFIATIEVVCMLLIAWNAWRWQNPQNQSENQSCSSKLVLEDLMKAIVYTEYGSADVLHLEGSRKTLP